MKSALTVALAVLNLAITTTGQAAITLTQWGSLATISTYDCVSDFCGSDADLFNLLTLSVDPIDGGVGETSAAVATGTWPSPGSASGTATVSSGLGIPILKAGAASDVLTWTAGQALAIQAYEYTGPGETVGLTWNLTGSVTNPDSDPITGLVVFAGFFAASDLPVFPDVSIPMNAYNLLVSLALVDPANNFRQFTSSGSKNETGNISIDVTMGDEFYLAMGLMAAAGGGGALAESLSTLDAAFNGAPALSPAFAAVPAPGALWLFTSALAGLIGVRRHGSQNSIGHPSIYRFR